MNRKSIFVSTLLHKKEPSMRYLLAFFFGVTLVGCCGSQNALQYDAWSGIWYVNSNKESVMTIVDKGTKIYEVDFKHPDAQWEGIGYGEGDELILVFRYHGNNELGYFKLRMESHKRATFTSYNPDGSYRSNGIVTR